MIRRRSSQLTITALAALAAGSAWSAAPIRALAAPVKATTHKYRGPEVDMRWGPVQVIVSIKGKKITNVKASAPMERPRSQFINEQALPLLKEEVLKAQSATIDEISGATMTSDAYMQSLQGALKKAHFKTPKS